jgi:outer membrane protein assembly factor BamB
MWCTRLGNFARIAAIFVAFALPMSSDAQSVIWSNPWTVQLVPSLNTLPQFGYSPFGPPPFISTAFAGNGDVLIGGIQFNNDLQITRLSSAGNLLWSIDIPDAVYYTYGMGLGAILAAPDGGAFVTVGDPSDYSLLLRIGGDGSVLWLSQTSPWWLAMPNSQTVVTAGCCSITAFDATTGVVLWQYLLSANANTYPFAGGIVADSSGNVYATVPDGGGFDALALDSAGQLKWKVPVDGNPAPALVSPMAVSSGQLFLNAGAKTIALNASDGSAAWDAASSLLAMAGNPADPVVTANGSIQRLAAATGQPLWTQTFSGSISFANFVGGSILIGSGNSVAALNPDTGSTQWSTAIPSQDGNGNSLNLKIAGAGEAGTILAVAGAGYGFAVPVFLQPIDSQTGQLETSPAITAKIPEGADEAESVKEDSGHIASVALGLNAGAPEIRVRRLNSSTGATLWESVQPLDGLSNPSLPTIASGGGAIVAVVAENRGSESSSNSYGFTWVGAFDDQTGSLRWQRILQDPGTQYGGQQYTNASAPVVDSAGNTYVAYGANISCGTYQFPFCTNEQRTLVKLAAVDGSTLWRFDNVGSNGQSQIFPLDFLLSGDDIVINGPFAGAMASHDGIELSGSDGSLGWTSDAFGGGGQGRFLPAPDGSLIGIGANNWVKVDASSGAVAWTNSRNAPLPCTVGCDISDDVVAPDNGHIAVGEADNMPIVDYMPGVQNGVEKFWRLDSAYTGLRSIAFRVDADSSGRIWLQLNRFFRHGRAGINFLAQLDPETGSMLSQQALAGFSEFPFPEQAVPTFISAPEGNRLLAYTFAEGPPSTFVTGIALIDTTLTATGNLSIHVTSDHAVAHPADVIGFHVVASYNGSAPISGAHVIADLSGIGMPSGMTCSTQSAANCVLDTRSGVVNATFDIQPGGQVDITGQVSASLASGSLLLPALVYGPTGLSELDTLDNFTTLSMTDEIFSNGF